MLKETIRILLARDLARLSGEVEAYRDEANLWRVEKGITNSAGNLCLHLAGNLNTYIGAILGQTGYVRNREMEFTQKDISRNELLGMIRATAGMADNILAGLEETALEKEYPVKVFDHEMTTGHFMVHLAAHLGYHLGQINYYRRLTDAS